MTKPADSDQIAKARRERAATMLLDDIVSKPSTPSCFTDFSTEIRELMCRFAASERQAVIEDCAKIAEDPANREPGWSLSTQRMIARAIRSME